MSQDLAAAPRTWDQHPAWAILFAGAPLAAAAWAGPLFIDDAFITFRFSDNIARGHGFGYNAAPVLGTTAPFYCLALAAARLIGIPMTMAAWGVGALGAAAAPVLLWRLGQAARQPAAGWTAALLLALFPDWWQNAVSGMETTLAGALTAAVVLLDLKKRPAAAGLLSALLILTRPDAALLPVIVFILTLSSDRRAALRFGLAGAAVMIPWIIFSMISFGSPLPHSLAAKSLIHAFPAHLALKRYLSWFLALTSPPAMAAISGLWLAGAIMVVRQWRAGLAAALWPPVFLLGLALTRVGPFPWYKVPVLPLYFFGAGLGIAMLFSIKFDHDGWTGPSTQKVFGFAVPVIFLVLQINAAAPYLLNRERLSATVEKEGLLREQAAVVRERVRESGRELAGVKVLAGEVGVLGYELLDAEMIDSAGIVSPEVVDIRRRDWERLVGADPGAGWREKWRGTPGWSREIIARWRPDYIVSNLDYCHLRMLAGEPDFAAEYELIDQRRDKAGNVFGVWERKKTE